jgi:hypothetical protein
VKAAPAVAAPAEAEADVVLEEGTAEVDLDGLDDATGLSDSVADLDEVAAGASTDDDEELPASSRRQIQLEAREPEPEAKPHPVPPESRRQVAIPPASDFEGDLQKSGVRPAADVPPEKVAPAAAAPAPAALKADVTQPVVATASPAVFRGAAPDVKPATFGQLLDATLSL